MKLVRKTVSDASPPAKKEKDKEKEKDKDKEREKDKEVKTAASKKVSLVVMEGREQLEKNFHFTNIRTITATKCCSVAFI